MVLFHAILMLVDTKCVSTNAIYQHGYFYSTVDYFPITECHKMFISLRIQQFPKSKKLFPEFNQT